MVVSNAGNVAVAGDVSVPAGMNCGKLSHFGVLELGALKASHLGFATGFTHEQQGCVLAVLGRGLGATLRRVATIVLHPIMFVANTKGSHWCSHKPGKDPLVTILPAFIRSLKRTSLGSQ